MKISEKRKNTGNKIKSIFMFLLAIAVALSLVVWAFTSGNLGYSAILVVIAALLLIIFGVLVIRRYKDAAKGLPFEDERSRRVMEKAAATTFYITIYVLLAIGIFSEDLIHFRDVSQATGAAIGIMALLWFSFWVYYNQKEI